MKKIYYPIIIISIILFSIVFFPLQKELSFYDLLFKLGRFAGLLSIFFLSTLVISGDLARFFDKFFGMDKIIKFQRDFFLFTLIFVLLHPLFFIIANKNWKMYLIPDLVYLPLTFGIIAFYLLIVVSICSFLYKRISYYVWQVIHIVIYILLIFALYHGINIGTDSNNFFVRILYYIIIILFIIGIIFRTSYKIKQLSNKFYVDSIEWETKDTFTIKLRQKNKLNFKPGQFCFLRLNKDKLYARHPFTISSSPFDDTLNFTVKLQGRFTKALSELKKSEQVIIEGPLGIFTIDFEKLKKENESKNMNDKKELVFFAGGVGITPFMSILSYIDTINKDDKKKIDNKITLFYGVRTEQDIIGKKVFDKIMKNKNISINIIYCLSQQKEKPELKNCELGYINENLIKKHLKSFDNKFYYICGPEPMKKSVIELLKKYNVKDKDIHYESFFW